jgi:4'-phosphopantetheinyl transferase
VSDEGGSLPDLLPEREIHVWCAAGRALDDPAVLNRSESVLDAPEQRRAARFIQAGDRNRFIIGRGLLRRLLGSYLRTEPRDIAFAANQYGRPVLSRPAGRPIQFNLSHTDGLVAWVFALDTDVGIDVERICPDRFDLKLAATFFPASAYEDIKSAPESRRTALFFEYWVLMESYVKARGLGLSLPLDSLSFAFEGIDRSVVRFTSLEAAAPERWHFELSAPSIDHRMAVVAGRTTSAFVIRQLWPTESATFTYRTLASSQPFTSTEAGRSGR